ncbi:MAG: hypothetical protein Q9159_005857 [Coniocarpon cinnabarinum]
MPGIVEKKPNNKKLSKNQFRRQSKKDRKQNASLSTTPAPSSVESTPEPERGRAQYADPPDNRVPAVEEESVLTTIDIDEDDPLYETFKSIISKFEEPDKEDAALKDPDKPVVYYSDDDDIPEEDEEQEAPKVSKKKKKQQNTLSIAELKSQVDKPELVEWTDVSSREPKLLVALKAHRNVVPVPPHWSMKREYLSSKRGIEKPAFSLPKFIADTGVTEMRDAVLEKQAEASLKQRQRERVAPKLGKLDLDYSKLYDAFFRLQTKPELTRFGEVYYEGKEYETNMRHLRPGELSEELKEALNIPPGAPPPWLINQQRYGPPPSYPTLRIPGLNAPPPPGSNWGFHPGGYGKPPVDDFNRPLYGGDVFGAAAPPQNQDKGVPINRSLWGTIQAPEEEESEEEEEDEDEDDEDAQPDQEEMAAGLRSQSGIQTTSGMTSMTPSEIGGTESMRGDFTLRKEKRGTETEESIHPRSAGQVIPEQQRRSTGFFGSDRGYNLNAGVPMLDREERGTKRKAGDVDVSMDMDALAREGRLSKDDVQRQYDAGKKAENSSQWGQSYDDDLSQMIAEEGAKRLKKDQERKVRR